MQTKIAFIGFGEAARAFAPNLSACLAGYDRKTDDAEQRDAKLGEFAESAVAASDDPGAALAGADGILSLVTADQALGAARASDGLEPGAFWFDMNSVAPATKHAAAEAITACGGRYVDVAVMAPVQPGRTAVPLLVSGSHARDGARMLSEIGFTDVRVLAGDVGAASAVKMIRSVMVKGMEALSAECAIAADAAGVLDEVIASLEASPPPFRWSERFDYNLDRMMIHGARRAAEMEEVVVTLDTLGTGSVMSRSTIAWQRALGAYPTVPPQGLAAKLRSFADYRRSFEESRAA